jgi:hypothetical protein
MSAREDYGVQLLKAAIKLQSPCDFRTRRARMIRGVPVHFDESTAKLYIKEIYGGEEIVTESYAVTSYTSHTEPRLSKRSVSGKS